MIKVIKTTTIEIAIPDYSLSKRNKDMEWSSPPEIIICLSERESDEAKQ
jgi:hypothetical protein